MTEQEIAGLGSAFASYLGRYRDCFLQKRTAAHFDTYCRGLLSDLPRKSVEPIALEAGTAVRTLQEFLVTARWDHGRARDTLQRQYLGCVGKLDNGIVTVHVGVARGRFQALLDAELYLPPSWDQDRPRCRAAGIPDDVRYRPKWRIALDQLLRLGGNGVTFDWLVFDEGYGAAVPFLEGLSLLGQRFVAEVPVNFAVRDRAGGPARRADERLTAADARGGRRYRLAHRTVADSVWRAAAAAVWVAGRRHTLIVAVNEATAEVKYFLTNATGEPLTRVLAVAFRRWTVEHGFRLGKQEAGLLDYEGRDYTGLIRHLTLALVVLGFVATHTERLRGEKSPGDGGAGVPGVEPALRGGVPPAPRHLGGEPHRCGDPLPPAAQRAGREVAQETAA